MYHVLITVQDKCKHAQLDSCVFADSRIPLLRKQVNVSSLAQAISSFHFYQYDQGGSTQYRINDGGNDMYDNGNVVRWKMVHVLSSYSTLFSNDVKWMQW